MMSITRKTNFSETAFTVKESDGYRLRWFTPGGEIDLCGHATLATAFVLFNFYEKEATSITFHTMSGDLFIGRRGNLIDACQAPARGGEMVCELQGDRVVLLGQAALFSVSELVL